MWYYLIVSKNKWYQEPVLLWLIIAFLLLMGLFYIADKNTDWSSVDTEGLTGHPRDDF